MTGQTRQEAISAASQLDRRRWISVLSRASAAEIADLFATYGGVPAHEIVKAPEAGTIMIEARAGGAGRRFNLGEATVTKCIVEVGDRIGVGLTLGREPEHARFAAIVDALLLDAGRRDIAHAESLFDHFITPLERVQEQRRSLESRKAARTKVEFFTMVRGEG